MLFGEKWLDRNLTSWKSLIHLTKTRITNSILCIFILFLIVDEGFNTVIVICVRSTSNGDVVRPQRGTALFSRQVNFSKTFLDLLQMNRSQLSVNYFSLKPILTHQANQRVWGRFKKLECQRSHFLYVSVPCE